jgi:eukaryotic-like serine/threonine-protein kinase
MLSTGEIVDGKYRIIRLIGEGGMGAVYEGENTRIHRRVAIKVLHAGVAETAEAVQRFEREAQAAGRIGSEHIVEVLDLGNLASGDRYMVMEFMDGDSLSTRIQNKGRIAPVDLYPIAHQLLAALHAAHTAGIIHRDLKPDNVYLLKARGGVADFVKLLDFGISKFNQLSGDSGFSMTRTGAVMGTPYYMAPEQAKGAKDMDHRVDLYATGVILYESVTGQVPFNADTFNELLFKIVLEEPRPIEQLVPDIDSNFAAIINKAMARDPSTRFQSAKDFQEALEMWANGAGAELANGLKLPAAKPSAEGTGQFARQPTQAQMPMLGTGTPGSWSNTGGVAGPQETPQKKSKTGLFAALGAVAAIAIVGAVVGMRAGKADATAAAAAVGSDRIADEEKAKTDSLAAAAKAQQAEADLKAEEAHKAADDAKAAEDAKAADANKVVVAPSVAELPKSKSAVSVHAAAPRPAPAVTKDTPKPAPAAAPPPPATTGRKIRTSL